ncbi:MULTISPECIES: hypothetical protein [unclassified Sphingomonas]|uniref:hypothetical protein n=1 Tax=unclassified Sphingomonas TaxID=196159 RepID=UPI0006F43DC1|nr:MULTISPECIES: hypothetical protein [unclassified Sphingomonas]KQX17792.1 hypothetical protein ASD17_18960 [Sphingomonas sp. Root1294]KQY70718.1 hypothetical protein ASD39_22860 [Sphingomonas sp. Root50]KRB91789.1 hypothetical protein ASE22_07450 [Sphingomonas sp. Root720]
MTLEALVAAELAEPVDPRVAAMAAAIAQRYGTASRAVLFYGSCLRESNLDGLMLDFYLVVSDYGQAFGTGWFALANRLLPPNVFPFEHDGLIAKYAVLSEADFARLASSATLNVSVWARFAQPSRLVWVADVAAREACIAAVGLAAPALLSAARPMLPERIAIGRLWAEAFALTYAAELRAERKSRAGSVADADPDRYRRFTAPALAAAGIGATITGDEVGFTHPPTPAERSIGERLWARRRREGKALTLARLAKASTTYAGGIDYLAWKINRHAGAAIEIKPWQRRWPILGAISLLPRLLAGGAVK